MAEPRARRDAIRGHAGAGTTAVVLDAETVSAIDITAVSMLTELADVLRRNGVELVLARDVGAVQELVLLGQGQETQLRTYPTVRAAVDAFAQGSKNIGGR